MEKIIFSIAIVGMLITINWDKETVKAFITGIFAMWVIVKKYKIL